MINTGTQTRQESSSLGIRRQSSQPPLSYQRQASISEESEGERKLSESVPWNRAPNIALLHTGSSMQYPEIEPLRKPFSTQEVTFSILT